METNLMSRNSLTPYLLCSRPNPLCTPSIISQPVERVHSSAACVCLQAVLDTRVYHNTHGASIVHKTNAMLPVYRYYAHSHCRKGL